jgi:hypothetical protein
MQSMLITTKGGGDRVEDEKEMQGKEAKASEKVNCFTCEHEYRGLCMHKGLFCRMNVEFDMMAERRNMYCPLKVESCYWHTSGDAEWQIKINDWSSDRYGADWHDKYTPWEVESLYISMYGLYA